MWHFKRKEKEDYDIHCRDRRLKNLIDSCYHERPEWDGYYETRVTYYVEEGIKYRELLREILAEGYAKHKRDQNCDIPDYQTFLSLEQSMIDDQDAYQGKTVCVEGYISYHLRNYRNGWTRDNSAVFIYPIPCKSEVEKKIIYALCDDMRATESLVLVSDTLLPTQEGLHIRVHGVPYFYSVPGGDRAGKVHILVKEYEVIKEKGRG